MFWGGQIVYKLYAICIWRSTDCIQSWSAWKFASDCIQHEKWSKSYRLYTIVYNLQLFVYKLYTTRIQYAETPSCIWIVYNRADRQVVYKLYTTCIQLAPGRKSENPRTGPKPLLNTVLGQWFCKGTPGEPSHPVICTILYDSRRPASVPTHSGERGDGCGGGVQGAGGRLYTDCIQLYTDCM